MKKLYILLIIFSSFSLTSNAQLAPSAGITAEVIAMNPQSGSYNYFGVKVSIPRTYDQAITVKGRIWKDGGGGPDLEYELVIPSGYTTAETDITFLQLDAASSPAFDAPTITSTQPLEVTSGGTQYVTFLAFQDYPVYISTYTNSTLSGIMSGSYDDLTIDTAILTTALKLPYSFSKSSINFSALTIAHLTENDTAMAVVAPFYSNTNDSSYFYTMIHDLRTNKLSKPHIVKTVRGQYFETFGLENNEISKIDNYEDTTSMSYSTTVGTYVTTSAVPCVTKIENCMADMFDFRKGLLRGMLAATFATLGRGAGLFGILGYCYLANCGGGQGYSPHDYAWGRFTH